MTKQKKSQDNFSLDVTKSLASIFSKVTKGQMSVEDANTRVSSLANICQLHDRLIERQKEMRDITIKSSVEELKTWESLQKAIRETASNVKWFSLDAEKKIKNRKASQHGKK